LKGVKGGGEGVQEGTAKAGKESGVAEPFLKNMKYEGDTLKRECRGPSSWGSRKNKDLLWFRKETHQKGK